MDTAKPNPRQVFSECQAAFPKLLGNAKLYSKGHNSIVARQADGTMTKIFLVPDTGNPKHRAARESMAHNEILAMRFFQDKEIKDVQLPKCKGGLIPLTGLSSVFTAYNMTCVEGARMTSWWDAKEDMPNIYNHFYTGGRVLARFHAAAENFPLHELQEIPGLWGKALTISTLPWLDDRVNDALTAANAWHVRNIPHGVVHGDFFHRNVKINGYRTITGLVDLPSIGHTSNLMCDIGIPPPPFRAAFISAYERESGRKLDLRTLATTRLSFVTERLGFEKDPAKINADLIELTKDLSEVADITGYKPQALAA